MIVSSTVDAFVDRDHVSTRYGRAGRLKVRGSGSNHEKYAFYWFALPFPLGVTVLEATLRLHLGKPWSGSQTLTAERITNAWKESKVNWNNRPSVATADAGTVNVASLGQGDEVAIDLTAMLAAVSAGAKWYGVRLKIDNDAGRELVSSDHPRADWHATLDVEWSEAPEAPVPLGPTGGRIISKTQPLLVWQFVDNAGSTVQASSQVQTSTTPDFTSPNFDSGKVANTVSQFDLAGTAFPALANGAVRYWRVKVWDGTDLESDWSEIQEFRRENKGTLAITNPDAAPANQVNETTPPIAWTFTGRTQEAFEAWLYRLEEGGALTVLALVAKTVSTALEWEVPAGILRTGDAYLARVAIFDDLDRQAMAGDPDYVDAEQRFAYERDGTPDPVTALTATPDGAKVVLEFARTTDPDYFAIRVDGREVLDRVEVWRRIRFRRQLLVRLLARDPEGRARIRGRGRCRRPRQLAYSDSTRPRPRPRIQSGYGSPTRSTRSGYSSPARKRRAWSSARSPTSLTCSARGRRFGLRIRCRATRGHSPAS